MFHVDLLTPYKETATYGTNYMRPPPDLINGEEEYEVEHIIDSRQFGRGCQVQYLVKWKGYPNSDNQWLKWQDINAPDLIAEYQKENPDAITHIRRGWNHNKPTAIPPSSSLSAIADLITPHLTSMSNVPLTPTFPGNTTETRGRHLAFYEPARTQVNDPTDRAAIVRQVMDLAQATVADGITRTSEGTPTNYGIDAGMDVDTNGGTYTKGAKLDETDAQTHIHHATITTATKEPTRGDIIPINVDTLEPGSPKSPIYVDALDHFSTPKSR